MKKITFLLLFSLFAQLPCWSHISPEEKARRDKLKPPISQMRADCAMGNASTDLAVNNVRARLQVAGDLWWDGENGRYIVPKIEPGSDYDEVSALFASGLWLGGIDPGGNLKVACQTYGRAYGRSDFFPGPLSDIGTTDMVNCNTWDRMFKVKGDSIRIHLERYQQAVKNGQPYTNIPLNVKGWPAHGNKYFKEIQGFDLPDRVQGLAAFFDNDGDGDYEPELGDFPRVEIRGCDAPNFPDEMVFWIFNDAGGVHAESGGDAIQMEVQATSFAYNTFNQLNNSTFLYYKLINRAIESIDSMYFGFWSDPDLGCHIDDYIGCDVERSIAYIYNEDALDGESSCDDCPNDVKSYCTDIPILGIDFMRGPLSEDGEELGMEVFTYYNNGSDGPPGTDDPGDAVEFYNYLTGSWRDGTPFTYGGNGYSLNSIDFVNHVFTDPPNDPNGWSMCAEGLPYGDRRIVQSSGPLRLDPGAVNELIMGIDWVPDIEYPCPDITPLLEVNHLSQKMFDNCFEFPDYPNAPDVDWVELDQELVAVLSNDEIISNNAFESYSVVDFCAPDFYSEEDRQIRFEGYKLFQLIFDTVTVAELDDPDKARLVFQSDVKNGIGKIYDWVAEPAPNSNPFQAQVIYTRVLKADGADEGIRHTFSLKEDAFATGPDKKLINHRKYYYLAVAYAYNNYKKFEQLPNGRISGQQHQYYEGRRNIKTYTVIPRPPVYANLNSDFGDAPIITRLAGKGNGGQVLDISDEMREQIFEGLPDGAITYLPGKGPLNIKIYNPIEVKNSRFELTLEDEDMGNSKLDSFVNWRLTELNTGEQWISDFTIDRLNEQLIPEYGFSLTIGQVLEPGNSNSDPTNGAQGAEIIYRQSNAAPWFGAIKDPDPNVDSYFDFIKDINMRDPLQRLSRMGDGFFVPYILSDYHTNTHPNVTPAWVNSISSTVVIRNPLSKLNNVDIVFTRDKAKWSRCVIIETANRFYYDANLGLGIPTEGSAEQFEPRQAASVGKDDLDGNGLPDPDGDGNGMGWFPGYAVDVETGERLNIFFGENSTYNGSIAPEFYNNPPIAGKQIGNDMMWNPTDQKWLRTSGQGADIYDAFAGGQHTIYVSRQPYDGCSSIRQNLGGSSFNKVAALDDISWAAIPLLQPGSTLLSYAEGLIPSEAVVKLRVASAYQIADTLLVNNGYPTYQFSFDGLTSIEVIGEKQKNIALDKINVFPNPYYGVSAYSAASYSSTIKITNLPAKCTVTIYTLDGKFVRSFDRNELPVPVVAARPQAGILETQILPDLEWDLRNFAGKQIASGMYLIYVNAPGCGERVLKWFGKIN